MLEEAGEGGRLETGSPLVAAPYRVSMVFGGSRSRSVSRHIRLAVAGAVAVAVPVIGTPTFGSASAAAPGVHLAQAAASTSGPTTNLRANTRDLGTLGGKNSEATAVDGDLVVGWSKTVDSGRHAFVYDLSAARRTMVDLGTLGGRNSEAVDVDGHVVVGNANTASHGGFGGEHAFAVDLSAADPAMLDLGTFGGGYSFARAVSGSLVVGTSGDAGGGSRAFVYDLSAEEPAMGDIGTLGGSSADAVDVDGTLVVGTSRTASGDVRAFAYDLSEDQPVMRDLGSLFPGGDSYAVAVDGTTVVGVSSPQQEWAPRAFAYDLAAEDPAMVDLGSLGGRSRDEVDVTMDVDDGVVVGASEAESDDWRAFAYDLRASTPAMRDVSSLKNAVTRATGVSGDVAVGQWGARTRGQAFAHDLSSDAARTTGLGAWKSRSEANGIDGDVVVGAARTGGAQHATAWFLRDTARPMVGFRLVGREVEEGARRVKVRVDRHGATDRAVSVRYRTRGDSARSGQDFVRTSGALRFAPGVTTRRFTVRILDDRMRERPREESLMLTLSRVSKGALLGAPSWSELTVRDDDR